MRHQLPDFADRDVMVFFGARVTTGLHVTVVAVRREGRQVNVDVDDAARRALCWRTRRPSRL